MKKNNKGFTLVEIIAVVTILGILLLVSVPKILDLVTDSRDEMYVQDAKKLIAQAQYVLSSNSDEVEKPIVGDYIVLSLNYLGTDAFSSPPNGGEYLAESSFVVVKNIQTDENAEFENYKYSVVLVEAAEDGFYRGIKFRTEEELSDEGAKTLVDYFDSSELVYVDEDAAGRAGCDDFDRCLVNNQYVDANSHDSEMKPADASGDNFTGRYNIFITQAVTDDNTTFSAPEFNAKVLSNNSSMQMLTGSLSVNATDPDNETKDLRVCINISKKSSNDFPGIDDSSMCHPYGDGLNFNYDYDLSKYGFTYSDRDKAYFYVVVVDPDRNYSRKRIVYEIHKNLAPEINNFRITRFNGDDKGMPQVYLTIDVTDDMDSPSDLQVCISDSDKDDVNTCNNYKQYYQVFNTNNMTTYTMKDSSGKDITVPDGSTHYLTAFIKDSGGLVSQRKAFFLSDITQDETDKEKIEPYVVYKNRAPKFDQIQLVPESINTDPAYAGASGNKLNVKLNIKVSDDISDDNKIKIKIGKYEEITMATYKQSSNYQVYNFDGEYDGEDRSLDVIITDEYGATTKRTLTLSNVYKNQAPKINSFTVTSQSVLNSTAYKLDNNGNRIKSNGSTNCFMDDGVCYETTTYNYNCGEDGCNNGGSYNVVINADIVDDMSTNNKLLACVSEDKNGCSDKSEYSAAIGFTSKAFTFKSPEILQYKKGNNKKKLYLFVQDEHGLSAKAELEYKIYENKAPSFIENNVEINEEKGEKNSRPKVSTKGIGLNLSSVIVTNPNYNVSFAYDNIDDDFNDFSSYYCYFVKNKDEKYNIPDSLSDDVAGAKCKKIDSSSFSMDYVDENGVPLDYDSQHVYSYFKYVDGYNEKIFSLISEYVLSVNAAPEIYTFSALSSVTEVKDNRIVPKYNSIVFNAVFTVNDPDDTFTACVTTTKNPEYCNNPANFFGDENGKPFSGNMKNTSIQVGEGDYSVLIDGRKFDWGTKDGEAWRYSFNAADVFGSHDEYTLLLVVKDSKGLTNSKEVTGNKDKFRYIPRYSCGIYDVGLGDDNPDLEIVDSSFDPMEVDEVKDVEITGSDRDKYATSDVVKQYLKPGEEEPITILNYDNDTIKEITPASCKGLCYVNSSVRTDTKAVPMLNNTNAFSRKTVKYIDKLVKDENKKFGLEDIPCDETFYSKSNCQVPACFDATNGKKDIVNNNVIGLRLFDSDKVWTTSINGKFHQAESKICKQYSSNNELLFSKNDKKVVDYVNSIKTDEAVSSICNNRCSDTEASCSDSCAAKNSEFEKECAAIDYSDAYKEYSDKYDEDYANYQEQLKLYQAYEEAKKEYDAAKEVYDTALALYNERVRIYESQLEDYNTKYSQYVIALEDYNKYMEEVYSIMLKDYEDRKALYEQELKEYEEKKALYEQQLKEYEDALKEYEDKKNNLPEGEELPPFDMERPTFDMEEPTFDMEKPVPDMEKPTFDVEKPEPIPPEDKPEFTREEPATVKEPEQLSNKITKDEFFASQRLLCVEDKQRSCVKDCKDNLCLVPCQSGFSIYIKEINGDGSLEDFYCDSSRFSAICKRNFPKPQFVESDDLKLCKQEINKINKEFVDNKCELKISNSSSNDSEEVEAFCFSNYREEAEQQYTESCKSSECDPKEKDNDIKNLAILLCNIDVNKCNETKYALDSKTNECDLLESVEKEEHDNKYAEEINTCQVGYEDKCIVDMEKYRTSLHNYEKVSCDGNEDYSQYCNSSETNCGIPKCSDGDNDCKKVCYKKIDSIVKVECSEKHDEEYYCDKDYLGGICRKSNCAATDKNCQKVCYKKVDCNTGEKINLSYVCHGYFKIYRSVIENNKVVLNDTGMRMCPELLSANGELGNRYAFDEKSNTPFIKFVQSNFGG